MRTRILITTASLLAVGLAGLAGQASGATGASRAIGATATTRAHVNDGLTGASSQGPVYTKRACGATAAAGQAECLALLRTTKAGKPLSAAPSGAAGASGTSAVGAAETSGTSGAADASGAAALPVGYGPAQLQSAYELAAAAAAQGSGQTVALVDAYDDPDAASDLASYRAEYGIPACTKASGCFRQVNQYGKTGPLPAGNTGWALEESLDLDMVSAICPQCHILLAEADNNSSYNLAVTAGTAARLGATQISNSYGATEYPGEKNLEQYYDQPGAEVTAAAGDAGYGVEYPAASQYVTAVGGTTLSPASNSRGWTESVWAGSGSGCSTLIAKPAWQHDACSHRTNNDVSAVANPQTPVAVYDSDGEPGWINVGGTSVASPLIASVYALLGDDGQTPGGSWYYDHPDNLFAVTSGSNGSCDPAYLCTARRGYSGPAGLGTPDFTGVPVTGISCPGRWSAVAAQPVPDQASLVTGAQPYTLDNALAVLSPDDVWTAGTYRNGNSSVPTAGNGYLATLENWNGSKWTQYSPPEFTDGNNFVSSDFTGLSFDRRDDGWAVGSADQAVGLDSEFGLGTGSPLVAHWDGSTWTPSPVLDPVKIRTEGGDTRTDFALPDAVAAVSPGDVWLAGYYVTSFGAGSYDGSFLEHWNGTTWSVVSFPAQGTIHLTSLDALSATDVWAAGDDTSKPLALHWNGVKWTQTTFAGPDGTLKVTSISGTAAGDIWAVGQRYLGSPGGIPTDVPYTEHWNGTAWSTVPVNGANSVAGVGTGFASVTAISPADAWAAGEWWGPRGAQFGSDQYLLAHWDGQRWTIQPEPEPANPYGLNAVAASSASNVWATGEQDVDSVANTPVFSTYQMRYGCRKA